MSIDSKLEVHIDPYFGRILSEVPEGENIILYHVRTDKDSTVRSALSPPEFQFEPEPFEGPCL